MTEPRPQGTEPPRLRKHLMDPHHPRPASGRREMSLTHVQQWVMSILVTTTILHLAAGVVVAAFFVDDYRSSRIGLLFIGGLFGVVAVAAGRGIHRKPLVSWWLLLGWIPALVGTYFMFLD
jgi:hypothetical protein